VRGLFHQARRAIQIRFERPVLADHLHGTDPNRFASHMPAPPHKHQGIVVDIETRRFTPTFRNLAWRLLSTGLAGISNSRSWPKAARLVAFPPVRLMHLPPVILR